MPGLLRSLRASRCLLGRLSWLDGRFQATEAGGVLAALRSLSSLPARTVEEPGLMQPPAAEAAAQQAGGGKVAEAAPAEQKQQQRQRQHQQLGESSTRRPARRPKDQRQRREQQQQQQRGRRPPVNSLALMEQLQAQPSCQGMWGMLEGGQLDRTHFKVLSAALDGMVRRAKQQGGPLSPVDQEAVRQLFAAASERLPRVNAWTLAAFVRFATAFKEHLDPAALQGGVRAWQAAAAAPGLVQQFGAQGACNTLLSLGTLAASDEALAAAVDRALAAALWRYAVGLLRDAEVDPWWAPQALYGASLLDVAVTAEDTATIFDAVRRHVGSLVAEDIVQVALGSANLIDAGRRRQAGSAVLPAEDTHHYCYPGGDLMGSLLHRASQLARKGRLGAMGAAQIIGACGDLLYMPREPAWEAVLAVLEGEPALTDIWACALLLGCAKLGRNPGAQLRDRCLAAVLAGGKPRHVCTAAWALAVLDDVTPAEASDLMEGLSCGLDPSVAELQMAHLALLHFKERFPGLPCPPALLEAGRAAHRPAGPRGAETALQATVAAALRRAVGGAAVAVEHAVWSPGGEGCLWVDVALPELRIAVETDGPYHYLRNVPGQQDGSSAARNRLLRAWGWRVVVVPHDAYNLLFTEGNPSPSNEQLVAGMMEYLVQALRDESEP